MASVGGGGVEEGVRAELQAVREELAESRRAVASVQEQRDSLQHQLDTLSDKFKVSEVRNNVHAYSVHAGIDTDISIENCLNPVTLSPHTCTDIEQVLCHSVPSRQVADALQQRLAEEQAHSRSLQLQLQEVEEGKRQTAALVDSPLSPDVQVGY